MTAQLANKPTVLFVCVHNAGRSQMAAGTAVIATRPSATRNPVRAETLTR
jgi:protein-tyrosine-phosphatase